MFFFFYLFFILCFGYVCTININLRKIGTKKRENLGVKKPEYLSYIILYAESEEKKKTYRLLCLLCVNEQYFYVIFAYILYSIENDMLRIIFLKFYCLLSLYLAISYYIQFFFISVRQLIRLPRICIYALCMSFSCLQFPYRIYEYKIKYIIYKYYYAIMRSTRLQLYIGIPLYTIHFIYVTLNLIFNTPGLCKIVLFYNA